MTTQHTLQTLAALALAAALAGCESLKPEGFTWKGTDISFDNDRRLREPERSAAFATFTYPELRRIEEVPMQFVFSDDIENVFINKRMAWGTSETVAAVPFATLLHRQFTEAVSEHFHPLVGDQQPTIRIFVDVLGVILSRRESAVKSEITLRVTMRDVAKDQVCHEKIYRGRAELPWDGGDLVPDAVYKSIQDVASNFLKDIAANRPLIARLEGATPDAASVRKPAFASLDMRPKNDAGVIQGSCTVSCNDWDACRVANWMRTQLEHRAENQLGIEAGRARVIYEKSSYDGAKKEWSVVFSAFARSEMVLNYDATTRSGTCVVDFELLGKTPAMAANALKDYVMQEMDKRAAAQQTGTESAKAQVRFDDFKTDQRYSLAFSSFHVVY